MNGRRLTPALVALAALGFLLVSFPLLSAADRPERVLGVPVLPLYLFATWALLIALVALLLRSR